MIPTDTNELVIVYKNAIENKEDEAEDLQDPWYWLDRRLEDVYPQAFGSEGAEFNSQSQGLGYSREDLIDEVQWESAFRAEQIPETVMLYDTKDIYPPIATIHRTPAITIFAFRNLTSASIKLDQLLEPSFKLGVIPYPPTPVLPVPSDDVSRVRDLLGSLKYDQTVADLVNLLSVTTMRKDITWLTGEAEDSPIESRHSFHPDSRKAAAWIKEQIEETGAKCELRTFLTGFAPNVIWSVFRAYLFGSRLI